MFVHVCLRVYASGRCAPEQQAEQASLLASAAAKRPPKVAANLLGVATSKAQLVQLRQQIMAIKNLTSNQVCAVGVVSCAPGAAVSCTQRTRVSV